MSSKLKYGIIIFILANFVACKTRQTLESKETKHSSVKKKYASILGVKESDVKNEKLYQFINDWYATPYKYGGKDKHGIDCSGLTATLYQIVYQKKISPSTKALVDEVIKIKKTDLKEGDLIFFNTNGKSISHVGVYLQNNKFVHASSSKGVMISDLNEPYFKKSYVSSGRIK